MKTPILVCWKSLKIKIKKFAERKPPLCLNNKQFIKYCNTDVHSYPARKSHLNIYVHKYSSISKFFFNLQHFYLLSQFFLSLSIYQSSSTTTPGTSPPPPCGPVRTFLPPPRRSISQAQVCRNRREKAS